MLVGENNDRSLASFDRPPAFVIYNLYTIVLICVGSGNMKTGDEKSDNIINTRSFLVDEIKFPLRAALMSFIASAFPP